MLFFLLDMVKIGNSARIEVGNREKLCFSRSLRLSVASLVGCRSLRLSGLGQLGGVFYV